MKIFFGGMCGVMMAPIAVLMKSQGNEVLGSDMGFYPPISIYLEKNEIKLLPGYKAEHITDDIDLIVFSPAILPNNPEYIRAKELGIKHYMGYSQFLEDYVIKENSIVCVGTYGKTTITAFLSFLLEKGGINPTFCIGGIPLNFSDGIRLTDSNWSITEGDEYLNSRIDSTPKFMYYKPKYVVINAAKHDHLDIYKSEDEYINAYKKLVSVVPDDGYIFANFNGENIDKVLVDINKDQIYYVSTDLEDNRDLYASLLSIEYGDDTKFDLRIEDNIYSFSANILGAYNIKNMALGISFAYHMGIDMERIKEAIGEFKGVKRRLEVRKETPYMVIDDLAHSPVKARGTIQSIKQRFPDRKLIAVFEPHTLTSRIKSSLNLYPGNFDQADEVLIAPVYHPNTVSEDERVNSNHIATTIGNNAKGFESFNELKEYITTEVKDNDILLFMSSGSFGGLIDYFSNL